MFSFTPPELTILGTAQPLCSSWCVNRIRLRNKMCQRHHYCCQQCYRFLCLKLRLRLLNVVRLFTHTLLLNTFVLQVWFSYQMWVKNLCLHSLTHRCTTEPRITQCIKVNTFCQEFFKMKLFNWWVVAAIVESYVQFFFCCIFQYILCSLSRANHIRCILENVTPQMCEERVKDEVSIYF